MGLVIHMEGTQSPMKFVVMTQVLDSETLVYCVSVTSMRHDEINH